MNTNDTKRDFTEAKQVLSELRKYVENKIESKKGMPQNGQALVQEISLASQPVIQSDHLTEEAELAPAGTLEQNIGATESLETNANIVQNNQSELEVPAVPLDNIESLSTEKELQEGSVAAVVNQPDMANLGQTTSEGVHEEIKENGSEVATYTGQDATLSNQNGEFLNGTTVQLEQGTQYSENALGNTGSTVVGDNLGTSNNTDTNSILTQVGTGTPTGEAVELTAEKTEEIIPGPTSFGIANDTQLLDTSVSALNQDNGTLTEETPLPLIPTDLPGEIAPQSEGTALENQNVGNITGGTQVADASASVENIGEELKTEAAVGQIPDVTPMAMPESQATQIPSDTTMYQASNSGAEVKIQDATPAVSDTTVIMPEGITADIAHDDTLVVGPDAFTHTR